MKGVYNLKDRHGWKHTGYRKKKKCERCPAKTGLVVHHVDRDTTNNEDLDNLETLCRTCHRQEHAAEITAAQRRPEVNARRGCSISRTKALRKGRKYPKISAMLQDKWKGEYGKKLRKIHRSKEIRSLRSKNMKALMNDPAHIEKRRIMKEARRAKSA